MPHDDYDDDDDDDDDDEDDVETDDDDDAVIDDDTIDNDNNGEIDDDSKEKKSISILSDSETKTQSDDTDNVGYYKRAPFYGRSDDGDYDKQLQAPRLIKDQQKKNLNYLNDDDSES